MELLLELLLTMVLSVLIAFLLGKIVSVAASDEDDTNAGGSAEEAVAPSLPGLQSSEVSTPGSRVVFSREVGGGAKAIGEIRVGLHAEGREMASACGDDCVKTDEDRRVEKMVRQEVEGLAVDEVDVGSEEARAKELVLEEADGGEKIPDASAEETEEKLANVTTEEIGSDVGGLSVEENLLLAKDAGQAAHITLSLDEEKEIAKELDASEVVMESVKDGDRLSMVGTDDVKFFPHGMATELENEGGGLETSVKHEKGSLFNEDDDWEGIEKSDLQKLFAAATAFVSSNEGSEAFAKLSNDLQMQLYGLHKIATEGPCYESQPMSLKVSARAKWHAWQRLGTMNPEMAMEQYITLLSDNIPGWMPQTNRADGNPTEGDGDSPDKGISGSGVGFLSSPPEDKFFQKDERKLEGHSHIGKCDVPVVSKGSEQGEHVTDSSLV